MTTKDSGASQANQTSEASEVQYLEHLGHPQYGTEFLTTHTITPADAKKAGWETQLDKDIVWTRRESGRNKGRMLLPLADLPAGIEEELAADPAYKVVTLKG